MAHTTATITAQPRDRIGSRYAQRIRSAGQLPGIIYGHKKTPVPITVDHKELLGLIKHGAHVLNVEVPGVSNETCLVKDLQFGYLGDNLIHIDFARVNLDEEVTVQVHLHLVGEAAAAKQPGAILTHELTELEVVCKVNAIPEEIKVDLGEMEGNSLTVADLVLPPGVETRLTPDTPIAQVKLIHAEEAEGEEVEVEAQAAPEVITEAKKEEPESEG